MSVGKIVIAGGTGAIGSRLIGLYKDTCSEIVVLTRTIPANKKEEVNYVQWDGATLGPWTEVLEAADVLINLSGRSVNCRFTTKNKKEILLSRVEPTRVLGQAIGECTHPPGLWINAGGISIFEPGAEKRTEKDQPAGTDFLAAVSRQWENAFNSAETPHTRRVLIRISAVLERNSGMLQALLPLVRLGLGGAMGAGTQYISWIHEADVSALIGKIIADPQLEGVLHLASPYPVTNKELMRQLRGCVNRPLGIPMPAVLVKLGGLLLGREPTLVLSGSRVVSAVLEETAFQFPRLEDALNDLIQQ